MFVLETLWLIQLAVCSVMTGMIWQVQLLTYPQFLNVRADNFAVYHQSHTRRMGWLVMPVMTVELALALMIAVQSPTVVSITALGLLSIVWASTALIQVPLHHRLSNGFHEPTIRRLILSNWIRTITWSIRCILICNYMAITSLLDKV